MPCGQQRRHHHPTMKRRGELAAVRKLLETHASRRPCFSRLRSSSVCRRTRSAASVGTPSIVKLLPAPVWPYAKMVPLKPFMTLSTMGLAVMS